MLTHRKEELLISVHKWQNTEVAYKKKLIRRESPPVLKSSVKDIPNHLTHMLKC